MEWKPKHMYIWKNMLELAGSFALSAMIPPTMPKVNTIGKSVRTHSFAHAHHCNLFWFDFVTWITGHHFTSLVEQRLEFTLAFSDIEAYSHRFGMRCLFIPAAPLWNDFEYQNSFISVLNSVFIEFLSKFLVPMIGYSIRHQGPHTGHTTSHSQLMLSYRFFFFASPFHFFIIR